MKRNVFIPLILILIYTAFVIICLLVYFSKGKSSTLIKTKLKLGSILLSLTLFSSGFLKCGETFACYSPVEPVYENVINITNSSDNNTINLSNHDRIISGNISYRFGNKFSYQITDINGNKIMNGNISALDGSFDSKIEKFNIVLENFNNPGEFQLKIYDNDNYINPNTYPIARFRLIVNE